MSGDKAYVDSVCAKAYRADQVAWESYEVAMKARSLANEAKNHVIQLEAQNAGIELEKARAQAVIAGDEATTLEYVARRAAIEAKRLREVAEHAKLDVYGPGNLSIEQMNAACAEHFPWWPGDQSIEEVNAKKAQS